MFPSFPGGAPGLGLLLLRMVLGIGALFSGITAFEAGSPWFGTIALITGAFLLAGFLTPLAAPVAALGASNIAYSQAKWSLAPAIVVAIAVALLGPGAFSIDARMFGRREIIIPPVTPRSPDSGTNKP
jgi:hypothetical protein